MQEDCVGKIVCSKIVSQHGCNELIVCLLVCVPLRSSRRQNRTKSKLKMSSPGEPGLGGKLPSPYCLCLHLRAWPVLCGGRVWWCFAICEVRMVRLLAIGVLCPSFVAPLSFLCRSSVAPLSLLCRSSVSPLSLLCQSSVAPLSLFCRSSFAPMSLLRNSACFFVVPLSFL